MYSTMAKSHEERNYTGANMFRQNSSPNLGVSIFIPNVWNTFTAHSIKREFIKCQWGYVEKVDIVPSRKSKNLNNVFVHFRPRSWNMKSENARAALSALQKQEKVKIFYSENRYFNCFISTLPRNQEGKSNARSSSVTSTHGGKSRSSQARVQARKEAQSFEDEFNDSQPYGKESEIVSNDTENDSKELENSRAKVSRRDTHSDASEKKVSVSYGRKNRISLKSKRDKEGLAGFFAAVEARRTYESASKLAYENKEDLPETFVDPGENASEDVKRAFTRAVYSTLGM